MSPATRVCSIARAAFCCFKSNRQFVSSRPAVDLPLLGPCSTDFASSRQEVRASKAQVTSVTTRLRSAVAHDLTEPNGQIQLRLVAPTVSRPEWDDYFLSIARAVSSRATCSRRSVGAVLVKDKQILATGYNGAPAGLRHCNHTKGGDMRDGHCARSTHAEQNAIAQAAKYGIAISEASLYCTDQPCLACAKLLINAGVVRVVFEGPYPDEAAAEMLEEAGVFLVKHEGDRLP